MSAVIDHLGADVKVKVLRAFTDLAGRPVAVGESGVIRGLDVDWPKQRIVLRWENRGRREELAFALSAKDGPRNGHMREYFAVGEAVASPDQAPAVRAQRARERLRVAVPDLADAPIKDPTQGEAALGRVWALAHCHRFDEAAEQLRLVGQAREPGHLESMAEGLTRIAAAYVEAGDEEVYVWLRGKALDLWYAWGSQATSGGEGAAMSVRIRAAERTLPDPKAR